MSSETPKYTLADPTAPLDGTYRHFFGNCVSVIRLKIRHNQHQEDPDGFRKAATSNRERFLGYMEQIDLEHAPAAGDIDADFIREVIATAEGDWTDPAVIERLHTQSPPSLVWRPRVSPQPPSDTSISLSLPIPGAENFLQENRF